MRGATRLCSLGSTGPGDGAIRSCAQGRSGSGDGATRTCIRCWPGSLSFRTGCIREAEGPARARYGATRPSVGRSFSQEED